MADLNMSDDSVAPQVPVPATSSGGGAAEETPKETAPPTAPQSKKAKGGGKAASEKTGDSAAPAKGFVSFLNLFFLLS